MFYKLYESPIGNLILESDGINLTSLTISKENKVNETDLEVFDLTMKWLDLYFKGINPNIKIPLKIEGSSFYIRVMEILLSIPFSNTMTYGEIARIIAKEKNIKRMSAQAVGNAIHNNKIAIIIPCHRVIGANNKLTGYALGIDIKKYLLKNENINIQD